MKSPRLAFLFALCAVYGCEARSAPPSESDPARSVEATDDVGRTLRLDRPARRIISLLPATTETLVAIGARDRLVGRTDYDDPQLADLPSVGGGLTPSLERIASLAPDLVVAWEEAGGARIRPRLESLGIPVFAVRTQDTTDIFANVERLGRLTGMDQEADSLAAHIRDRLAEVRESVASRPHPLVLYLVGLDPPIVAGPSLFIGQVLEIAGGRNVFPDVEAASPQMSVEEILRRRPDVVMIPTSPSGDAAARLAERPGWSELVAGGTRIVAVPQDILHRPGPSIAEAARILRDTLHPEVAER